ncbi:ipa protein [Triangularia verruculosa]|uniref:Ipa protein n=1 Tax=Triangularia verruculosa TaxID=2587418 RepID=A0AAN6XLS4_9PEZI|nr:ipa protein [Triangularia verruculosa]
MASLGESVVDLHADLVNKYRQHAGAIERIWRTLNQPQRTACMKAELRMAKSFAIQARKCLQPWDQYATGLSNGPGDRAYIVEMMEKKNLRPTEQVMQTLKPAIDAGHCVPQNTGDLILLRQQYLLQSLNIMVEDVLEAGSKTRAQKAPAKSKKTNAAMSDAFSKLQIQDGKKKAKLQLSLGGLVAAAGDQKDVLDDHLGFLSTAPVVLTRAVNRFLFSRSELVPDEKGRRLPVHTDKYISGAVFEALHTAVQDVVVWDYLSRLLQLLEANTADKIYRAIILQEISNVCHYEYSRAQTMFKRTLQTDMGSKWFKRVSNAHDEAGNPRVTMKGKPEDLTATDPLLHYMLRLTHPDTTASKAAEWLTRLSALVDSHPDERTRINDKEGDALFNLAVVVGFIQDLSPVISMPSLSRKKGQMFVSRFNDLEAELNGLKDQVELREFAVPIDNLLEPGMAEGALQSFDKFIVGRCGTKMGFLYQGTLADCLEDLHKQYQEVKVKLEKKDEPTPLPSHPAQTKEERIEQRKQKEKTRGTPSSVYEITPHAPSPIPAAKPPAKPFKVSKTAGDVFATLFNSSEDRGTLLWLKWTMEVKRPLTLHRPHGSEVGRHLILAFAQRLKRVYGWNEDSFVV